MSHTPGPWVIEGESGNPGEGEVITSTGRTICWTANTWDLDGDEEAITAEDRANARLIACAPEMLDALRLAKDALDLAQSQVDSENDRYNLCKRLVAVKRVIARAEGRE